MHNLAPSIALRLFFLAKTCPAWTQITDPIALDSAPASIQLASVRTYTPQQFRQSRIDYLSGEFPKTMRSTRTTRRWANWTRSIGMGSGSSIPVVPISRRSRPTPREISWRCVPR